MPKRTDTTEMAPDLVGATDNPAIDNAQRAPTWLSVNKAAPKHANVTKSVIDKALKDPRFAEIFAGNTRDFIYDPEYPAIRQVTDLALDAWIAARVDKPSKRGPRAGRGRKYFIFVKPDQVAAATAALAPLGIELARASGKRSAETPASSDIPVGSDRAPEAAQSGSAALGLTPVDAPANPQSAELELIEA